MTDERSGAARRIAPHRRGGRPFFVTTRSRMRTKPPHLVEAFAPGRAPIHRFASYSPERRSSRGRESPVSSSASASTIALLRTARIERTQLDTTLCARTSSRVPLDEEGFGLPVIEALRVGCPPSVADATALHEAFGARAYSSSQLSVDPGATRSKQPSLGMPPVVPARSPPCTEPPELYRHAWPVTGSSCNRRLL